MNENAGMDSDRRVASRNVPVICEREVIRCDYGVR